MQKIQCKYADAIIAPANAVVDDEVETMDGVKCRLSYQATFDNENGRYDEILDDLCQRFYSYPFCSIRSIWIGRIGRVSNYWHWIKLIKI